MCDYSTSIPSPWNSVIKRAEIRCGIEIKMVLRFPPIKAASPDISRSAQVLLFTENKYN